MEGRDVVGRAEEAITESREGLRERDEPPEADGLPHRRFDVGAPPRLVGLEHVGGAFLEREVENRGEGPSVTRRDNVRLQPAPKYQIT